MLKLSRPFKMAEVTHSFFSFKAICQTEFPASTIPHFRYILVTLTTICHFVCWSVLASNPFIEKHWCPARSEAPA